MSYTPYQLELINSAAIKSLSTLVKANEGQIYFSEYMHTLYDSLEENGPEMKLSGAAVQAFKNANVSIDEDTQLPDDITEDKLTELVNELITGKFDSEPYSDWINNVTAETIRFLQDLPIKA